MKKLSFLLLALLLPALLPAREKLFENGRTTWSIDTGNSSNETICYAGQELKNALFKISGVNFPFSGMAEHRIILKVDSTLSSDHVSIRTRDGNLLLSGGSERSVLYAAYTFLQKYMGVRWLWPGASGEFMPRKESWEMPDIDFTYTSAIPYRVLHQTGDTPNDQQAFRDWMARNFVTNHWHFLWNTQKDKARGFYAAWAAHAAYVDKKYFKQHPEYFALTNGIRHHEMFCFSNPEAIRLAAENIARVIGDRTLDLVLIFPQDSHQLCECPQCSAQKGSDKWFNCFDKIVEILKQKYPKTKFFTSAYMGFMDPPSRLPNNAPFLGLTTYKRCNIHLFADPACPFNKKESAWIEQWKNTGARIGFYNYEFCTFSWKEEVMIPFYSLIDETLKMAAKQKAVLVTTEVWQGGPKQPLRDVEYMKNRLGVYLYAQLMWNPSADCDELIRDWCRTVYGKAADPMYCYFKRLNKQWTSMDAHMGILDRPVRLANRFVTPELCAEVRSLFLEADRLNGGQTPAVEYEKYLFGQWMRLAPPEPKIILPRVKEETSPGDQVGKTSVLAAWNSVSLFFNGVKLPFEAEITPPFAEKPFHFSIDAGGKKSSDPASASEWEWKNGAVSIPVSVFRAVPEPGFYWGLRLGSGTKAWPAKGLSSGSMIFSDNERAGRTILWGKGADKYDDAFDREMQNQFLKMGWNFQFATQEQLEQGDFPVYVFCHAGARDEFSPEMWTKIWEKVREGAMLVIQPPHNGMNFKKITDDENVLCRIHGIGQTLISDRKAEYLRGDWLKKPFDLQREFNRGITPAYSAVPERPEGWQTLATQPKSSAEKNVREPFILFRPYGKGFVVVFCQPNYGAFSPAVLIANLYENREDLRGKSL